jgi:hypothetical protein
MLLLGFNLFTLFLLTKAAGFINWATALVTQDSFRQLQ